MPEFQNLSETNRECGFAFPADFPDTFALHAHKRGLRGVSVTKVNFCICAADQPTLPIIFVLAILSLLCAGDDGIEEFSMECKAQVSRVCFQRTTRFGRFRSCGHDSALSGPLVEGGLEFVHGLFKAGTSTKRFEQFDRRTHGIELRNLENLRIVQAGDAFVLILLEQGFQYGAGLLAVLGEDIPLADIVRPFPSRQRRLIEGHMADEVEGIEIFPHFIGQWFEQQPFLFQLLDDGLLALGAVPLFEKRCEAGIAFPERLLGVVAQSFGHELTVFVQILDPFRNHADFLAVDVVLTRRRAAWLDGDARRGGIDDNLLIFAWFRWNLIFRVSRRKQIVRRRDRILFSRFVDLHRLPVEVWIGKMIGRLPKVDEVK